MTKRKRSKKNPTWEEAKELIAEAARLFPEEFGLRGYPGDRFRINLRNSYFGGPRNETLMLYTDIYRDDEWTDFAKGTVTELRREVVLLKK